MRQLRNQRHNCLPNLHIPMILVSEDNLADLLIVLMHEHAPLLKELLDNQQRTVDIFNTPLTDALDRLIVYFGLPHLPHGLVSLTNNLEASTDCFPSGL